MASRVGVGMPSWRKAWRVAPTVWPVVGELEGEACRLLRSRSARGRTSRRPPGLRRGHAVLRRFPGHREGHALLGLADPDLGVAEAAVLERRGFEGDEGADFLAHLAHRAGEAARAAVGDGGEQAALFAGVGVFVIAGFEDDIHGLLLGDRVADLDGVRELVGVGVGEFVAGEGRAVDAVAAGAPPRMMMRSPGLGSPKHLSSGRMPTQPQ